MCYSKTGPFPGTAHRGNTHVVLITDYYSKWVEAFPVQKKDGVCVARCISSSTCRWDNIAPLIKNKYAYLLKCDPSPQIWSCKDNILLSKCWLLWGGKTFFVKIPTFYAKQVINCILTALLLIILGYKAPVWPVEHSAKSVVGRPAAAECTVWSQQ